MIGQTVEAEGGEMNEAGFLERLAGEGVVDASRLIALTGPSESIGLLPSGHLVPEVAPSMLKPSRELRPPLLILRGVGVEVTDHEGALIAMLAHPWLELIEGLFFHGLGGHVNGRDSHSVDAADHPVILELVALLGEALVSLQLKLTIDPHVTLPAMKGSPRAVLVAGRCQARLIMLLAALKEFGQDDDIRAPTNP